MKLKAMFMLAVFTAASNIALSLDTLKVRSYRVINTCSNEQRFLIDAYMGEIFASDSLQSFDITIGYDTSLIRPTDGLSMGTLSSQMTFSDVSPFFNFRIPGEMRVGAFTIDRNVRGDLPFFAIAGNFKGSCSDSTWFDFPWEATFNGEFKRSVTAYWSDTVTAIATAAADPNHGLFAATEPDTIPAIDSGSTIIFSRSLPDQLRGTATVSLIDLEPDGLIVIDTVFVNSVDSVIFDESRSSVKIYDKGQIENDTMVVKLRSRTKEREVTVKAATSIENYAECACIVPSGKDTVTITAINTPDVSVYMDSHESTGITIRVQDSGIEIQFLHGQPSSVQMFTIQGERLIELTSMGEYMWVATDQLPKGSYILSVNSDCCVDRRLLLK